MRKKSYVVRTSLTYADGYSEHSHPQRQQIINTNLGAETGFVGISEIEDDLLICFYSSDISKTLKAVEENMFSKTTILLVTPFLVHEQINNPLSADDEN